ncbi:MAG: preprotein translocase subunit SecG [Bacteroidetes bacterium]|nr:preprotein translocase subunit SecG [Bacteroidota bacterium]MBS1628849.1 preprotein translocase subunit SecG [Bacteroidota bacterium]
MITLITILILLTCVVLTFFILVQKPKGGGLTGGFGTLSTQVMGVKQSTDVMEKGTWTTMGIIAGLCLLSVMFLSKPASVEQPKSSKGQPTAPAPTPGPTAPTPAPTPAP